MSDYIIRDVAIDAIENADADVCQQYPDGYCSFGYSLSTLKSVLAKIPAADAEPVRNEQWEGYTHSRFLGLDEYGEPRYAEGVVYYCSNPKCRRKIVIKERYCPNCGAKMDLEERGKNAAL